MTTEAARGERPAAHVEIRGDGAPLVMLHGWGASSDLFAPLFDALQPGRRIIAPDLPGFGATAPPDEAWAATDYARWTLALLDRLGVDQFDVVGHSNGGRVAIVLGAEHAQRVRRMVLTASAGIRRRRGIGEHIAIRTYKMLRGVERSAALPNGLRNAAKARADRRGSDDYRAASGVMRSTLVRLVNEDLSSLLPRISAPTLLVWGDRDTETPLDDARVMERVIPDAGLVVFEGGSHYAYLEQAARFCRVVDVFLRDQSS